eukprot:gene10065-20976_t
MENGKSDPVHKCASGTNSKVAYSVSNIAGKSNEDRYFFSLGKEESTGVSSFGIFDGHGGDYASTECAIDLHDMILSQYDLLTSSMVTVEEFKNWSTDPNQRMDSLFCESVRSSTLDIDKRIRKESTAGSTAVSLFIFHRSDGSSRIFCPWIADGKAVTVRMSEDHKPTLEREQIRIQSKESLQWTGLPCEVSGDNLQSLSSSVHSHSKHSINTPASELSCNNDEELKTSPAEYTNTTSSLTSRKLSYPGFQTVYEHEEIEPTTHNVDALDLKNTVDFKSYTTFICSRTATNSPKANQSSKGDHNTMATGPLAVYSRFGYSIMMTRSIGDRYGPRSCIPVPDITAITIPANQHARFVLASDGLWDVMDESTAQGVVMSIQDAKLAARKLAQLAWHRRFNQSMRLDDITVLVVDVNPSLFTPTGTLAGCSCSIS